MSDRLAEACALLTELAGEESDGWDRQGRIPTSLVRRLGREGLLSAQVPAEFGGMGLSSQVNGELTAHAGSLCGSLRSLMTSQGMAAWTIQRWGTDDQRGAFLPRLTGGELAGVAFSEPEAGSDLSAMRTEIRLDGEEVVVDGQKTWVTGAAYADLLVVFGRDGGGSAVTVVPATTAGVRLEPVPHPLGCRAAGHAHVHLDRVRLPADHLITSGQSLALPVTSTLTYGRLSVAWGCVGILRACLAAATRHARSREQFGKPLAQHQLVARHLAELVAGEQAAMRLCEHASRCWDTGSLDMVTAAVLAKYVGAANAARGAAAAVQVLGSAGMSDGAPVARAYRDAKAMESIEGTTEICQLLLAEHALAVQW
jgi:methoxymalonate biosynthesis protein